METLQAHDLIRFRDVTEEILGRVDDLVFTQRILENGGRQQVNGPFEISDLVTLGFEKVTLDNLPKAGEL